MADGSILTSFKEKFISQKRNVSLGRRKDLYMTACLKADKTLFFVPRRWGAEIFKEN
jgi:hypothetical protein